jgi:thioredoxin-dependent peroxiredoxin
MIIAAGTKAPDFSLPDENNVTRRLSEFRGQITVLYFYPKDDTPGCTTEACNFRDNYSAYVNSNLIILGVSPDTPLSHKKFKEKYSLPFPLLADIGHLACDQYGVWGLKKSYGREYYGVMRTTFLIDANGYIARVFEKVSPAEHSVEVLEAVKTIEQNPHPRG